MNYLKTKEDDYPANQLNHERRNEPLPEAINMLNENLLEQICNTPGISGFEDPIQALVAKELAPCCDELNRDAMGNLIGLKKATRIPEGRDRPLRVMLAAHADEIGMMAKYITDNGCVKFEEIGVLFPKSILSQHVIIHGKEPVHGVIVPDTRKQDKVPSVNELLIDCGLPVDEVKKRVEIGSPITFTQPFFKLNENVYAGRNFDDRVGTFCLLEAMKQVGETQVDVYACSTVQEEVDVRGSATAAYAVNPDIGIAVDGGLTSGGYIKPDQNLCELGGGAAVYLFDGRTISSPALVRHLFELGKQHGIACQRNFGGGTDASQLQRQRNGALATTVGAPVRYMHSTVQLVHVDDILSTIELLKTFLENAHILEWPMSRIK